MQNIKPEDFYKQSYYNFDTKNQLWCSQITDAHDNFCCCDHPFAHLLSTIFPLGHTDRDLTINQILERDYKQCHSGGKEEENGGGAGAATGPAEDLKKEDEEYIADVELEDLIKATEDAGTR